MPSTTKTPTLQPTPNPWIALAIVATLAFGASSCSRLGAQAGADAGGRSVSIAAAANIALALDAMRAEFQKNHPDVLIDVTYGSSGLFYAQLQQRAPFDMFLSADEELARKLVDSGLAQKGTEFLYSRGELAIWVPRVSAVDVQKFGVRSLLDPSIRKIAISDPEHTIFGRATEASMRKLGVYDQVRAKFLPCTDTARASQMVESGAADAAVIGSSLAAALSMKDKGRYWQIPLDAYPPIQQEGVIMSWARDPDAARAVREFIIGPEGKAIFQRYGFLVPS